MSLFRRKIRLTDYGFKRAKNEDYISKSNDLIQVYYADKVQVLFYQDKHNIHMIAEPRLNNFKFDFTQCDHFCKLNEYYEYPINDLDDDMLYDFYDDCIEYEKEYSVELNKYFLGMNSKIHF